MIPQIFFEMVIDTRTPGQHQVSRHAGPTTGQHGHVRQTGRSGRSGVENGWWFVIFCGLQPLNVTRNIPYITGVKLNILFIDGTALPSMDGYTDSPATIQYLDGFHSGFNTAHFISTWKQRIKPMTSLGMRGSATKVVSWWSHALYGRNWRLQKWPQLELWRDTWGWSGYRTI